MTNTFITVYEIKETSLINGSTIFPIILIFFGLLALIPFIIKKKFKYLGISFFFLILGLTHFISNYNCTLKKINSFKYFQNNKTKTVEGIVNNFVPSTRDMSPSKVDKLGIKYNFDEKFSISGIDFLYDPADSCPGYSQTYLKGGYIKPNIHVRITYIPKNIRDYCNHRNIIVKLEILK